MKLALLSNVTTGVLEQMLRGDCEVWSPSGNGAWAEIALDPPRELVEFGPDLVCLLLDSRFERFDVEFVATAVARLRACVGEGVPVIAPDLPSYFADLPSPHDERLWRLARMPWSMAALRSLRQFLVPQKKVLAVDLDNTLWRGVLAEDGHDAIVPDDALISEIRALVSRGILLVVISRNDPDDVSPVLARLGLEPVALRLGWQPKASYLVEIAAELNLGLDSFVFLDDDPVERAEMRARLPEVCIAVFPPRLDLYFPPRSLTAEDLSRASAYRAEAARRASADTLSLPDYLASLQLVADVHPLVASEIPRVVQLSQKVNQFLVTPVRYDEATLTHLADDSAKIFLTLSASDRFGDYGLVGYLVAEPDVRGYEITAFAMSCRAMNRRLEFALFNELRRRLSDLGVHVLSAVWRRLPRNAPVERLFDDLGFTLVSATLARRDYVLHLK